MEFDETTYSVSLNGTKIENQLQDADPNVYFGEGTVTFLSRNDWTGTWPIMSAKLTLIDSMVKELTEGRWATMGEDYFEVPAEWKNMPKFHHSFQFQKQLSCKVPLFE